jgi:hypothetical protein
MSLSHISNEWLVITAVLVCSLFLTFVNFVMLWKQRQEMGEEIDFWRDAALEMNAANRLEDTRIWQNDHRLNRQN